jgi:predicted nucleic acid-binding Zn ribbon protein
VVSDSEDKKGYKSRRSNKRLISINSALHSTLQEFNLVDGFMRYQFVVRWPEIVGEEISKRAKPECLRGSTLVIRVCNSAWAQELSFQKQVILNRLERFNDYGKKITDIRFCVSGSL